MIGRPLPRLVRRAAGLASRVSHGLLRVFPFSLGYAILKAALRLRWLAWRGAQLTRVGEAKGSASPLAVLLWLDRIGGEVSGQPFDVCLRLPPDVEDDSLHDVFSILLVSPRLQSLALYWDEERLLEDLPLFQARRDRAGVSVWSTVREDLGTPGSQALRDFLAAGHEPLAVPVTANREARTLLKRLAGGAWTVCLNLPDEARWLAGAVTAGLPDARFFDMRNFDSARAAPNLHAVAGWGLTLHEHLALVADSDAYVGSFDLLAAAALIAGRPAVLLGGEPVATPDRQGGGEATIWIADVSDPALVTRAVLEFLGRHWPRS